MKLHITILLFVSLGCAFRSFAQLEKVVVETYYVTDANDATNTEGGQIESSVKTYRVFFDLEPGAKLLEIFGDEEHPFFISSTEHFYNNADGNSFGYQIPKVSYEMNTVALDTYLTLGQTGFQGINSFFGLPKEQDTNGSFIGGVNNDGGSAMIEDGLLINEHPDAGIPLTVADGMDTLQTSISDWFHFGVLDFGSGNDSSIFGNLVAGNEFYSENFSLRNSGVKGVDPDSNFVLVAQLTTAGQLSFTMNARIMQIADGDTTTLIYYGTNILSNEDEFFNPFLIYPQVCGCQDPNFVEYDPAFACSDAGACITPVVIGCTDTLACNYSAEANTNVQILCCYPGFCAERDIEQVCPQLKGEDFDIYLYPNPATESISLNVLSGVTYNMEYTVYNYYGEQLLTSTIPNAPLNFTATFDLSSFISGIYQVRVKGVNGEQSKLFVKL
ncbi:MAG: T9SS type A sorting domain-containing protein [Flavobacteriales bacterium]